MKMKRCKKCVLPARVVGLSADGVCALCRSDDGSLHYRGEQALLELLEASRRQAARRGAKYDCIVPVSGGKDSTYALHQMVTRHHMRTLAFYYESPFAEETSKQNLDNAVRILGVELVRNTDSREQQRYLKRNLRCIGLEPPRRRGLVAGLLCTACNEGYKNRAYALAAEHKVNLIMQGGCPVEPDLMAFRELGKRPSRRSEYLRVAARELWELITDRFFHDRAYHKNISLYTPMLLSLAGRVIPAAQSRFPPDITRVSYHDFIPWDEQRIVSTLSEELQWRRPPGRSTTTRFDCKVHSLLEGLRKKYLGVSEVEVMYSMMIRKGMLTRQEALRRVEQELAEEEGLLARDLEEIAAVLGMQDRLDRLRTIWGL